ncbi:MAG TPA: carboxypeptidase regulatory-like domain-containing protein [Longimicrobiales bacterium]|nr:carboxypeptidase regulatory-like domain-containing protein [Longimicrobiales bacterium]
MRRGVPALATFGAVLVLSGGTLAAQTGQVDAAGQAASALGEAIRAACGTAPEEMVPAVVAGTVTDSVSGVPLPQARVRMEWQSDDAAPEFADTRADERGYFQFCYAPAGETVVLIATLRVASAPVSVDVEPNMLHVERLYLTLSDPDEPGLLAGRVIDAESRRPVANAEVRLVEREGARTLTTSGGYFSLGMQPWGIYTVSVSALGYMERSAPVRIQGGLTGAVEIPVSTKPIPIAGVEVTVRGQSRRNTMDDLVSRMRLGFGSFVTRDMIERRPSARAVDFLRDAPGVQVRFNGLVPSLEVRGRPCAPDVYIDGDYWSNDIDFALTGFYSEEIEAMEIYRGFSEIPGQFIRSGVPPCAVISIWTR